MNIHERLDLTFSFPLSESEITRCFGQLETILESLDDLSDAVKRPKKRRKHAGIAAHLDNLASDDDASSRLKKLDRWMKTLSYALQQLPGTLMSDYFDDDMIPRIRSKMRSAMKRDPELTLRKMRIWASKIMIPALESRKAISIHPEEAKDLSRELATILDI